MIQKVNKQHVFRKKAGLDIRWREKWYEEEVVHLLEESQFDALRVKLVVN